VGRPKGAKNKAAAKPPPPGADKTVSNAQAVREALAAGIEAPGDIADFAKSNFGLDIPKMQASAHKSQLRGRGEIPTKCRRSTKDAGQPKIVPTGEGDLLDALEAMKPVIAQYGAEKVKKMVDILG
jgi:hypothetical protein